MYGSQIVNHPLNEAMQSAPLISIIVAVFNGSATLQNCLDSIVAQTYPHKELIVMDGGSSDGTVGLLEANSDAITYWESKADNGIAHAWNKGLRKSRGEWILFIGADDRLHDATVLSDMATLMADDADSDLVYGQIVFGDGPYANNILGRPFDWSTYRRRMLIPHTGCFQRRRLFDELGDFDESYKVAIDYEIFLRKPALKARFVPRMVTIMGGGGMSTRQAKRTLWEGRQAQLKNKVDSKFKIEMWHAIYQLRGMFKL